MPTNCSPGRRSKRLLDRLGESHPKLVEELVPKTSAGRNSESAAAAFAGAGLDPGSAADSRGPARRVGFNQASRAAGRGRAAGARPRPGSPFAFRDGGLRVLTLDHTIEEELSRAFGRPPPPRYRRTATSLCPAHARRPQDSCRRSSRGSRPILLCPTPARFHLRRLLEPFLPKVVVLSPLEIPSVVPVQSVGVVR